MRKLLRNLRKARRWPRARVQRNSGFVINERPKIMNMPRFDFYSVADDARLGMDKRNADCCSQRSARPPTDSPVVRFVVSCGRCVPRSFRTIPGDARPRSAEVLVQSKRPPVARQGAGNTQDPDLGQSRRAVKRAAFVTTRRRRRLRRICRFSSTRAQVCLGAMQTIVPFPFGQRHGPTDS